MMPGVLRAVEQFLLPNVCVACERPIERTRPAGLVCGVCRARLAPLIGGCTRCGQPLPPVGPCRFCADWPDALTEVRSAVWLSDEAREIVHHLKYEGYRAVAAEIADMMVRRIRRPPHGILVPIPLSPRRQRTRGFNQAAEIAVHLAGQWRLPLSEDLVRRIRDTKTQTALAAEEREANVRGAFRARRHRGSADLANQVQAAVILVDDVLTTGATLAAAARSLATAGWLTVSAVTFARALTFSAQAVGTDD